MNDATQDGKAKVEQQEFELHKSIIYQIFYDQAGTLPKAILEGIMNCVDANATRCDITLDRTTFTISDDGKGFVSRDEIDNFFKTFGTPHDEADPDGIRFGTYRIGRGQIMAYAEIHLPLRPVQHDLGREASGYDLRPGHA